MGSTQEPLAPRTYSRRRTRSSRFRRFATRLWTQWRVELLIALALALGLFLLLERMEIRETLSAWLQQALQKAGGIGSSVHQGLGNLARRSPADLVGIALVALTIGLIALRVRRRLVTSPRFATRECPRCGSGLQRVHRHFLDRVLNLYIPVRRYRCRNHACGWHGLRTGKGSGD